jgi:hypothetical protein
MSNVCLLLLCDSSHETSITFLKVFLEEIFLQPIYWRVWVSEGSIPVNKNSYMLLIFHLKLHVILASVTSCEMHASCNMAVIWDHRSPAMFCSVLGSYMPTFRNNRSVSSSRVKRPKKKVNPKRRYLTNNLRCVTSQNNEGLVYTTEETWHHACHFLALDFWLHLQSPIWKHGKLF